MPYLTNTKNKIAPLIHHESYINLHLQAGVSPTLVKLRGHFMTEMSDISIAKK